MNSQPPSQSPGLFGRPVLTAAIALAVLAGIGGGGIAFTHRGGGPAPLWLEPAEAATVPAKPAASTAGKGDAGVRRITVSATGDIIMGSAPNRLPPDDGAGFFDSVRADLRSDLVMGNLEQPLTADT